MYIVFNSIGGDHKKLVCSIFCFVILVSTATTYQTKAEWTGFYGTVGFNANPVSSYITKDNYEYRAWVDWQTTNFVCKMWFRIRDTSNNLMGEELIDGVGMGDVMIVTSGKFGNPYRLWANREHLGNPMTTISGEWQP